MNTNLVTSEHMLCCTTACKPGVRLPSVSLGARVPAPETPPRNLGELVAVPPTVVATFPLTVLLPMAQRAAYVAFDHGVKMLLIHI